MVSVLHADKTEQNAAQNPYADILEPLLKALHWQGQERHLHEAQMGLSYMDLDGLQTVLAHLGYKTLLRYGDLHAIAGKSFPVLLIGKDGTPHLLRHEKDAQKIPSGDTTFLLIEQSNNQNDEARYTSIASLFTRFTPLLAEIGLISLLIGALALAPTFYNMALYDTIIPNTAKGNLPYLFLGVSLALAAEIVLRTMRNRRLGFFAARMDHFISCSVFDRLLFLPPLYTERASVSAQLARLRDFEAVREFFTGPLGPLFFEMPLIVVYTAVMFCFAGPLGFVPVALTLSYVVLLKTMDGSMKKASQNSARAVSQRQEFVLETISKLRAIRLAGLENIWRDRYDTLLRTASIASFKAAYKAQVLEIGSYILMTLGAMATLGFGVVLVINQTLTTGALIAAMMLVWRIVAPLQICCASMNRIQQLRASTGQVQRLLAMQPEQTLPDIATDLKGRITFHRVSLRYAQDIDPALLGVSFDIQPGQVVAIKGDNGSGKSTILKVILGLYQPQSGAVRFDGIDLRQLNPLALRQTISYVPQHMELLPGTIRDNMLYADPSASDEQCQRALQKACAWEEIQTLPRQLDTVIVGENAQAIPFMLEQRINLARAYLRPAKIMLFDEASHSLGLENDLAFAAMIEELRGHCTVVLATHREDHMRLADTLMVMNKGELTHMGPPEQVLQALRGKKS